MSLTYSESCKKAGIDRSKSLPDIEYRWVGYSRGKIIECRNMTEAAQYSLHDRLATPESVKIREDFTRNKLEKEKQAISIFQRSLREDYSAIPDDLYEMCYAESFKRKHSEGYDQVAIELDNTIAFAEKVLKVVGFYA